MQKMLTQAKRALEEINIDVSREGEVLIRGRNMVFGLMCNL
jgi:hypothetical protein